MSTIFSLDPTDIMNECQAEANDLLEFADSIGTSDISCAALNVLKCLGLDPHAVSSEEFQLVRQYLRSCL